MGRYGQVILWAAMGKSYYGQVWASHTMGRYGHRQALLLHTAVGQQAEPPPLQLRADLPPPHGPRTAGGKGEGGGLVGGLVRGAS